MVQRRDDAVQHMVYAGKLSGTLHCNDVLRLRNNADQAVVALLVVADGAKLPVGQIPADRTQVDGLLGLDDGVGKLLRLLCGEGQEIKCQPLCGLAADARQLCELLCQPLQSGGKIAHRLRTIRRGSGRRSASTYSAQLRPLPFALPH